jgi:hypothetical protein
MIWRAIAAANDAMDRFERDHPVAFAIVAIPVIATGVILISLLPLVMP